MIPAVEERWVKFREWILTITREAVPLEEQLQKIKKDPWQTKKVKRQFLLRDLAFKLYHQLRTPAAFAVLQEHCSRAIHMQRKERIKFAIIWRSREVQEYVLSWNKTRAAESRRPSHFFDNRSDTASQNHG